MKGYHVRKHRRTSPRGEVFAAGLKTMKGTPIGRYKGIVGKQVGSQLYVHKDYASMVIDPGILRRGIGTLHSTLPSFKYNCVMYDRGTGAVRFDEASDFDIAREPHVGRSVTIGRNGTITERSSNSIWHHKWMWVMDDYPGFDVPESRAWSAKWLRLLPGVAKGTDSSWLCQLSAVGLR